MTSAIEPNSKADIIPITTALLLFIAALEDELEVEPEVEVLDDADLEAVPVPVADPAEEVGATETRP